MRGGWPAAAAGRRARPGPRRGGRRRSGGTERRQACEGIEKLRRFYERSWFCVSAYHPAMDAPTPAAALPRPTVFFISDGTGITAETFGNSILSQFAIKPRHLRRPFIDTPDKAHQVVREINHIAEHDGRRPIVFVTLVNVEILSVVKEHSHGLVLDMFNTFIEPLEAEFGITSNHRIGRFSDVSESKEYSDRIEAINFALAHDDGQSAKSLAEADVILVGVSRSGKTPTSLYLAMQHGIKAANYPLIPEDFERGKLPSTLVPFKAKCFGLTIDPERLARIRTERRPNSKYASLENCRYEVREGETMMKREGIAWLSSTHKSIEEIATTILRDLRPDRLTY
jgi:regulator of PEP synthase PpsR (kinase-PPPase family)